MREIVKYWRSLSYPIIVYLDDGWCCLNPKNCYKIYNSIRQDLKFAGFIVNEEKRRLGTKLRIGMVRICLGSEKR